MKALPKYPNPCDTCTHCTALGGCERWLTRYRYRQKQINAYAKKLMQPIKILDNSKFRYEHPSIVERYLKLGPCHGCKLEAQCETPCRAYWTWWNARMEWLRRKYQ